MSDKRTITYEVIPGEFGDARHPAIFYRNGVVMKPYQVSHELNRIAKLEQKIAILEAGENVWQHETAAHAERTKQHIARLEAERDRLRNTLEKHEAANERATTELEALLLAAERERDLAREEAASEERWADHYAQRLRKCEDRAKALSDAYFRLSDELDNARERIAELEREG